ncbi:restriction endonuclease subunit S [Segatella copri]|uniref:restriction endonuclease subunit S n=1 Tax=Segatella copri TaxID=165179 RepID=UPI003F8AF263
MEWKELQTLVKRKIGYGIVQPGPSVQRGVPIIKVNNIISGLYDTEYLDKTTVENDAKYQRTKLKGGELIVTVVGTCGKTAIVPPHFAGCNLVRATCLIDIEDETICRWIKYYIDSPQGQAYINRNLNTTVQATLNVKNLNEMPIPFYSKEYTSNVVKILSSLDRKIELNNKINADLEEMAQAIFKNWFVDFEPFKDSKFVDSELGMIPEGWKVGCLGDLITIKYGKDHKKLEDGTFPVYGSGGFMRFVNSWLYDGESVLIPRKGTLDNIMYVCEKFWTVDTMFFSVPKMDYVMKYVYNYIKRFDFSKMNEGTSVPSNTAARLNKMPILIPTHEILEMYDETLCPIYNKRKMKDKESRILSLLRDTLLPRLMSGELEVPE